MEEISALPGAWTMGELSCLSTEQPLSEEHLEEFKAAYRHMRRLSRRSSPVQTRSEQNDTAWSDEDDEAFQKFLSVVTDKQKFSRCLKGDPKAEPYIHFYKILNSILNADNISSISPGELMRFDQRKFQNFLHGVYEEKHSQVITYYAKGAHLVGLHSRQLLKYIQPNCSDDTGSPYSRKPYLNPTYRPHIKYMSSLKIQHIKSNKSKKTVEIEDRIRQLTVKREGMKTNEMVTPVKIKVHLKVKNREALTYDDINQIRRKANEGVDSYLRSLTLCKRWDTLQSWRSLQNFYPTLSDSANFPESFSTYSWSWSGRRNMVEICELVEIVEAAAASSTPASSVPHKSA
ncbi:EF-hand calcium-binding domain-containing protein 3-like [Alosa sapidissima]|uniref:EF-hand calcium-binding domain-containing protein 3-like n=1 Tax=Alosa sapidissima TaxID=34773 RepID=UPI001C08DF2F|nr:EF-hand calcium-binding domain-containing protein 3-like [Alosa sapidissima]